MSSIVRHGNISYGFGNSKMRSMGAEAQQTNDKPEDSNPHIQKYGRLRFQKNRFTRL